MPDAIFEDPRLAAVYDPLDPDRSDLDVYVEISGELGARSVDLNAAGYVLDEELDAPNRPGRELVFFATRA